ncbi:MAG: hypothetical protein AUH13_27290 [Acidobacteria bacterium 13_2_20CM_58_27]|nr:MAG: hypothetical protein AUH13_27290 [Acidobacteria bacterium 13_2_20CM_58_27]
MAARRVGIEFANHFQGNNAPQALVLGFVDPAHPAFANFCENAVRTNALGDFRHGDAGCTAPKAYPFICGE